MGLLHCCKPGPTKPKNAYEQEIKISAAPKTRTKRASHSEDLKHFILHFCCILLELQTTQQIL